MGRRIRRLDARLIGAAGIALAIAIYLWWELRHLAVFAYNTGIYPIDDADEWRYTSCAGLVSHGYALFNQVFSAQPPLLFLSLAGGMRVAGQTIEGARWVVIAFGLLALLSVAWLVWSLAGPYAAAAGALLLTVSTGFLVYSHTVEAEVPMMAMAALSLALILRYGRDSNSLAPVLAGLAAAAAILLKLFAIEIILPTLWLVLSAPAGAGCRLPRSIHARFRHQAIRGVFPYSVALAAPVILDFALVSPLHQWQQVIALHNTAATVPLQNLLSPFDVLGRFLSLDLGLSCLAVAGLLIMAILRRWRVVIFLLLWLGGSLLMLLVFRPLFPHHAAILSAPLVVTAAAGIGGLADAWRLGRRYTATPVVLAILIYLVLLPRLGQNDRHVLIPVPSPSTLPLSVWIRQHSTPMQFVAADEVKLADAAGRLEPPPLCDPSDVRVHSGYLTKSDLIAATQRYMPVLVLPSRGTYAEVAGYLPWLRRHYRAIPAPEGVTAFVRR